LVRWFRDGEKRLTSVVKTARKLVRLLDERPADVPGLGRVDFVVANLASGLAGDVSAAHGVPELKRRLERVVEVGTRSRRKRGDKPDVWNRRLAQDVKRLLEAHGIRPAPHAPPYREVVEAIAGTLRLRSKLSRAIDHALTAAPKAATKQLANMHTIAIAHNSRKK
jgi:hypothetical protein